MMTNENKSGLKIFEASSNGRAPASGISSNDIKNSHPTLN